MIFVVTVLGGIVGAAFFGFAALVVVGELAELAGVSSVNGGSAMFAVVVGAPVGALIGLILGVWVPLKVKKRASFGAVAGHSALTLAVVVGVSAVVGGMYYYIADDIIAPNRLPPVLEFEVRLPATFKIPQRRDQMQIDLQTEKNTMPAELSSDSPLQDGDKVVLRGVVDVYYKVPQRFLAVNFPGEPILQWRLKLARNPSHMAEFSPWQRVDYINDPKTAMSPDDFQLRYRLDRRGAP